MNQAEYDKFNADNRKYLNAAMHRILRKWDHTVLWARRQDDPAYD